MVGYRGFISTFVGNGRLKLSTLAVSQQPEGFNPIITCSASIFTALLSSAEVFTHPTPQ